ncbi:YcxB family protein [Streptomyces sp. NPDC127098]|uniref:YcxB family protein n=1 Tax=Streptomyces sp. NPDC127098 TaxID=3347137 RepID=UPI00365DD81E
MMVDEREAPRPLTLIYTPVAEDFRVALRTRRQTFERVQWQAARLPIFFLVVMAMLFAIVADNLRYRFLPVVVLSVCSGLWVLARGIAAHRQARGFGGHAAVTGECRITLDASGIQTVTAETSSVVNWAYFLCHVETERHFVLFGPQQGATFIPLPKRAIAEEGDVSYLRALLDRYVNCGDAVNSVSDRSS